MGKKKDKKPKKQKTVYIDDGRTIADMSTVGKKRTGSYYGQDLKGGGNPLSSSFRERAKTYFAAVRMMFLPMLAFMGMIALLFLVLYFAFGFFA